MVVRTPPRDQRRHHPTPSGPHFSLCSSPSRRSLGRSPSRERPPPRTAHRRQRSLADDRDEQTTVSHSFTVTVTDVVTDGDTDSLAVTLPSTATGATVTSATVTNNSTTVASSTHVVGRTAYVNVTEDLSGSAESDVDLTVAATIRVAWGTVSSRQTGPVRYQFTDGDGDGHADAHGRWWPGLRRRPRARRALGGDVARRSASRVGRRFDRLGGVARSRQEFRGPMLLNTFPVTDPP